MSDLLRPRPASIEMLDPVGDIELAREMFQQQGHVAVVGLHTVDESREALKVHDPLFYVPRPSGNGVSIANIRSVSMLDDMSSPFARLYQTIVDGSAALGHNMSASEDWLPRPQLLRLPAGLDGPRHRDCIMLDSVTAVTNLEGESDLVIESKQGYAIEPGVVVYMRGNALTHQAHNRSRNARIGLAATRLNRKV